MTAARRAGRLDNFTAEHGYTVTNALQVYADRMRAESDNATAAWESVKDDPAKVAAQDQTFITTMGLYHAGRAFAEAAAKATEALDAWQELTEEDE